MNRGDVVLVDWAYSDLTGTKLRPAVVVQADFLNGLIDDTVLVQITGTRHGISGTEVGIDPAQEIRGSVEVLHGRGGPAPGPGFDAGAVCHSGMEVAADELGPPARKRGSRSGPGACWFSCVGRRFDRGVGVALFRVNVALAMTPLARPVVVRARREAAVKGSVDPGSLADGANRHDASSWGRGPTRPLSSPGGRRGSRGRSGLH